MDLKIIQSKIYEIRGFRVMLDSDLASLYQVETKALKQAVKRNIDRFPEDFMFELTKEETEFLRSQIVSLEKETGINSNLRSQIVTSSWGGSRYQNFVFTEQGVAMLSSVLRSDIAVKVNIQTMRAFVLMRQMISGYEELLKRIEELEESTDAQFSEVYKALTQILSKQGIEKRKPISYVQENNQNTNNT